MKIEFCTFANTEQQYTSDLQSEELSNQANLDEIRININTPRSDNGDFEKKETFRDSEQIANSNRDTFVEATRANRIHNYSWDFHSGSNNQNWLAQLGDALHLGGGNNTNAPLAKKEERKKSIKDTTNSDKEKVKDSNNDPTAERGRLDSAAIVRDSNTSSVTSPENSGGSKSESSNNTQNTTTTTTESRFTCYAIVHVLYLLFRCFLSIFTTPVCYFIDWLYRETLKPEDPHGYSLSFLEMCKAVKEGNLRIGWCIVVLYCVVLCVVGDDCCVIDRIDVLVC